MLDDNGNAVVRVVRQRPRALTLDASTCASIKCFEKKERSLMPRSHYDRLTRSQVIVMRSLAKRSGSSRAVTIDPWQRKPAIPLWRCGLIEIWYRQTVDNSLQGPFFGLTIFGAQLASNFFPRLGVSGAEQST